MATDLLGFVAEEYGARVGLLLYHLGALGFEVVILLSLRERARIATRPRPAA
jgi:hypothetical protein